MKINLFGGNVFLAIDVYISLWALYFFLALMVLVFIFIMVFSFYKRRLDKKKKSWQENVATIISNAVFFEDDGHSAMEITPSDKQLLTNKTFRQYFIDELIHAKKNLSGAPVLNLKHLYEMLALDTDSLQKIRNKKWHIKAKGIQELAIMEQVKYVKQIFRLTNDAHELVRNEAQCALVHFYDFQGLRFLNVIVHEVSTWQQIQLLNYLHDSHSVNVVQLKKWLRSQNKSVVTIALRLATFYNCREVYNDVIHCLHNGKAEVQMSALDYLQKNHQEDTSDEIIKVYASSDRRIKLSILSVLQQTASQGQLTFLMKQLHNTDDTIKVAAAKTLSLIHPAGPDFFRQLLFADEHPWDAIFSQIDNDRAA